MALGGDVSFVSAEFVRNIPVMGFLASMIQSIFVNRGIDEFAR